MNSSVQSSKFKVQSFVSPVPRSRLLPRPTSFVPRPSSRGFTYIALLAAIVILGISLGATGKYWSNIVQREKEEELLFRGNQYVIAIERYTTAIKGVYNRTPSSIDNLLSDIGGKRHLRRRYKDPITGEDFVEIFAPVTTSQTKQLIGVHSSSDKEPIKQSNFPSGPNDPSYFKDFEGKKKYSDWQFVYQSQQGQQTGISVGTGAQTGTGTPTGTSLVK